MTLDQFKQQLAEMKKARSFILLPDGQDYVRWRANFPYQEGDIHVIEAPNNWLSLIEKLESCVECLDAVMKQGIAHYEDCISLTESEGDEYCDCGATKVENKIIETMRMIMGGE